MSSASDYMGGIQAPTTANYAAPQVDFSSLSNLVGDYVKGKQMAREEQKATLFRNGIPKDPSGNIDFNEVTDRAAKVGGIDYAMPLLNLQMQRDAAKEGGNAIGTGANIANGGQPQPQAGSPAIPQASQTTSLPGPRPTPATPGSGDQAGSIVSVLTDAGVPEDQIGVLAGRFSSALKVDPNASLTPEQANAIKTRLGKTKVAAATPVPQQAPVAPTAPPAEPSAPAPTQRVAEGFDAAPKVDAQTLPGDTATADRLDQAGAYLRQRAATLAKIDPKGADAVLKQADAYADRAKQIREQIGTANQPAPSIKEWRQSGSKLPYDEWVSSAKGAEETAKQDAIINSKKYEQYVENGHKAQQEIPQLELLQEQMNDPNFFSGAGEKYVLLAKRLKSAVGMDPDAPVPQELLRKVTASNVLGSLGALKGLGPIRVAEMNMAREAAAAPDNSVPANKLLVEIAKRTHQRNAEIADLAQAYKDQNGMLDVGFDKKVTQFYKDKPLFNDAEIKDWHKIIGETKAQGPTQTGEAVDKNPPMQTFVSPMAVQSAIAAGKLQKGDGFMGGDGKVHYVP